MSLAEGTVALATSNVHKGSGGLFLAGLVRKVDWFLDCKHSGPLVDMVVPRWDSLKSGGYSLVKYTLNCFDRTGN